MVHGLGAHSGRWEFLADFFLKNGIASYSIELKGFGETTDLKGHVGSFDIYYRDILSLYEVIGQEQAGKRIFIVGESMGALLSFIVAAQEPGLFSGVICLSPAIKSRMKFSPMDYLNIFSSLLYAPKKQIVMPFTSAMCTRDTAYQKVMDSDPREHRFATPRLLVAIAGGQLCAARLRKRLAAPVLFLVAGDHDQLIDPAAAEKFFAGVAIGDKKLVRYPDMYHALSIDLGREKVFGDMLEWIETRLKRA